MARWFDGGQSGSGGGPAIDNGSHAAGFGGTTGVNGDSNVMGGVASGAAAGGAVGGPWGAIIGAAASLVGGLMKQKDDEKARKLAWEASQKQEAQKRLFTAQGQQVDNAGEMGNREQNAIQQLMGVFARSAR